MAEKKRARRAYEARPALYTLTEKGPKTPRKVAGITETHVATVRLVRARLTTMILRAAFRLSSLKLAKFYSILGFACWRVGQHQF